MNHDNKLNRYKSNVRRIISWNIENGNLPLSVKIGDTVRQPNRQTSGRKIRKRRYSINIAGCMCVSTLTTMKRVNYLQWQHSICNYCKRIAKNVCAQFSAFSFCGRRHLGLITSWLSVVQSMSVLKINWPIKHTVTDQMKERRPF